MKKIKKIFKTDGFFVFFGQFFKIAEENSFTSVKTALTNARKESIIKAMERIYFDHAATTSLDPEVLEKMLPYFSAEYGNADSLHALGRKAMNAVDEARDKVAELLGAKPNEIYFTSGGTESDNWAMFGGAYAQRRLGRKKVLVSAIEHHAVMASAEKLSEDGFDVQYLPVTASGKVDLDLAKTLLTGDTALVAVMMANNETGAIQPVKELATLAKEQGSLFFTDCVQAAPYLPLNVGELGVDTLALSAHKFYGPKGCGVLYIQNGVKMDRHILGGEQERGLRGGTTNVPAVVGLATAYEKTVRTMQETHRKLQRLRTLFLGKIACLDGVRINGDENGLPAIVNLQIDGVENSAFLYKMDLQGVCLAAGSACASASLKPSHVLTAMGLTEQKAKSSVRFSFGKDNTEEEILRGAELAVETVRSLRNF